MVFGHTNAFTRNTQQKYSNYKGMSHSCESSLAIKQYSLLSSEIATAERLANNLEAFKHAYVYGCGTSGLR